MIATIYIAAALALGALVLLYATTRTRFTLAADELDPEVAELQAIGSPVDAGYEDECMPLHDHHSPQLAKLSEHLEK